MGATWRPGEDTDTRLWHSCGHTESNIQFGGSLDAIYGCTLRPLYMTTKVISLAVGRKLTHVICN